MNASTTPANTFTMPATWTNRAIRIALIGAGGTGSQLISGLARLHIAMRSLGHPEGLQVEAWDGDSVSGANIGRQLFSTGDIGRNKASVLVHRINCYFGLDWEARPERFCFARGDRAFDILITCVDTAAARREIHQAVDKHLRDSYVQQSCLWLDCGNGQQEGQVMLGQIATQKGTAALPSMRALLPEIFDETIPEDDKPSCSLAEALESQDLFINQVVATWAGHLLWTLYREGEISICGYWINLGEGRTTPVSIASVGSSARKAGKNG